MSGAKTVAIIGAGPVGLAAAAHVLERGMEPIVLEAGDDVGHAVRQWGHVQHVLALGIQRRSRRRTRLLGATGWNSPAARPVSDRRRAGRALSRAARHATRALKDRIRHPSRVTGISRVGFDKVKTKGRDAAPFEIRYQNGKGPRVAAGRRGDRRHPAPGIRPVRPAPTACPPSASTQAADGSPTACPTCWAATARAMPARPSRVLGAGHSAIGTLIDLRAARGTKRRTPSRSGCCAATIRAKAFGGGANDKLVAARRAGRGLRRAGGSGQDQGRKRIPRFPHLAPRRRSPASSAPAPPAAAARSSSTN